MKTKLFLLFIFFVCVSTAQTWTITPATGKASASISADPVFAAGYNYARGMFDSAGIYLAGFNAGKLAIDTLAIYTRGFKAGQISMIDTVTIVLQGRMKYVIQGNNILLIDTLKIN